MTQFGHTPEMLDDVAVYALGALPAPDARRVREHIAECRECASEYDALAPAVTAVGASATATGDVPGALLKRRVMHAVRPHAPAARPPVWPAYLVAAACLAIAVLTSVWNVALMGQIKQTQAELAQSSQRSRALAVNLAQQRATLSDLLDANARHVTAGNADVVSRGNRLYLAMHSLPAPPRGHVYQAWTLAKGATRMTPAPTFVPDAHGVAVIALGADPARTAAVGVTIEPEGGSKQPTTKPLVVVPLSS